MDIIDEQAKSMEDEIETVEMDSLRMCHHSSLIGTIFSGYPMTREEESNRIDPLFMNQTGTKRSSSHSLTSIVQLIDHHQRIPSFLRDKYDLLYGDLMARLKVSLSIIDYNYTRLMRFIHRLKEQQIRFFYFRPSEIEEMFDYEYPLVLEFFLQFDRKQ